MSHVCITIPDSKKASFSYALSDALCWLDGFKAGGGTYFPASENVLRDLRDTINRAYPTLPAMDDQALSLFAMRLLDVVRTNSKREFQPKEAALIVNGLVALMKGVMK